MALTDIVQVTLLVLGGLVVIGICARRRSAAGTASSPASQALTRALPEHFDMILDPTIRTTRTCRAAVLVGGMWIMNLSYWGFNQYIIQRALAAKSIARRRRAWCSRPISSC